MKIILVFCLSLLIASEAYSQIARKDLVSYTLDFYQDQKVETRKKDNVAAPLQQEKNSSATRVTASSQSKKIQQKKKSQGKLSLKQDANKVIVKEEKLSDKKSMQKTESKNDSRNKPAKAPVLKKTRASYGTKLSFSKTTQLTNQEKTSLSKSNESKKETKDRKEAANQFGGNSYVKGVLKNTHPYFIEVGEFTNNLYRTRIGKVNDYVTKLYPGFEFKRKESSKKFDLYVNTGLQALEYASTTQNDHISPYASGLARYGFGKIGFITSASARRTRGAVADLSNEDLGRFVDSWVYDMGQDFKINFNKLDVDFQYSKSLYGYVSEDFRSQNHSRDVIAMRNSLKILPKTKLFVEYAHAWLNFNKDSSNNLSYDRYIIGLKGKIFRKLDGTIKVGYDFNKRKSLKDLNGKILNADLTYKASGRLNYRLNFSQGLGSINLLNENVSKYSGISLGCSYLPPILKKLKLSGDVSYWNRGSDYQTRSNFLQVSLNPEYKFREWLMFGLGYDFEQRVSKTSSVDSWSNTVRLKITSEF